MFRSIKDLYRLENDYLAPFAVHAECGGKRRFPEKEHPFRTAFQRDRDRILHSKAFRRLEYKTQVFLSGTGDHLRNRLTHTIEVAAITRTIARALRLNEDLAEAIALAHDLGHTPYGHAGERALHELMADQGGFDHNLQALRIVDFLEIKYPDYDGINLTWEVRCGLMKHREDGPELDGVKLPPQCSLEAQAADLADDLTYYGHDADDGLDCGLLNSKQMEELEIWREALETARKKDPSVSGPRLEAYAIRCLIDNMVGNAIRTSAEMLQAYNPSSPEDVLYLDRPLITFSEEYTRKTQELKAFLYKNLYFGEALKGLNEMSHVRLSYLYRKIMEHPELMGCSAEKRIATSGICRAAADYVAGMTDRFASKEYERLRSMEE